MSLRRSCHYRKPPTQGIISHSKTASSNNTNGGNVGGASRSLSSSLTSSTMKSQGLSINKLYRKQRPTSFLTVVNQNSADENDAVTATLNATAPLLGSTVSTPKESLRSTFNSEASLNVIQNESTELGSSNRGNRKISRSFSSELGKIVSKIGGDTPSSSRSSKNPSNKFVSKCRKTHGPPKLYLGSAAISDDKESKVTHKFKFDLSRTNRLRSLVYNDSAIKEMHTKIKNEESMTASVRVQAKPKPTLSFTFRKNRDFDNHLGSIVRSEDQNNVVSVSDRIRFFESINKATRNRSTRKIVEPVNSNKDEWDTSSQCSIPSICINRSQTVNCDSWWHDDNEMTKSVIALTLLGAVMGSPGPKSVLRSLKKKPEDISYELLEDVSLTGSIATDADMFTCQEFLMCTRSESTDAIAQDYTCDITFRNDGHDLSLEQRIDRLEKHLTRGLNNDDSFVGDVRHLELKRSVFTLEGSNQMLASSQVERESSSTEENHVCDFFDSLTSSTRNDSDFDFIVESSYLESPKNKPRMKDATSPAIAWGVLGIFFGSPALAFVDQQRDRREVKNLWADSKGDYDDDMISLASAENTSLAEGLPNDRNLSGITQNLIDIFDCNIEREIVNSVHTSATCKAEEPANIWIETITKDDELVSLPSEDECISLADLPDDLNIHDLILDPDHSRSCAKENEVTNSTIMWTALGAFLGSPAPKFVLEKNKSLSVRNPWVDYAMEDDDIISLACSEAQFTDDHSVPSLSAESHDDMYLSSPEVSFDILTPNEGTDITDSLIAWAALTSCLGSPVPKWILSPKKDKELQEYKARNLWPEIRDDDFDVPFVEH